MHESATKRNIGLQFHSARWFGVAFLAFSAVCSADTLYTDQNKLFRSARQVGPLGPSLFGDKVNLYTGALEFIQNDVFLPGNSALPVGVGRRLVAGQRKKAGHFGTWDLEIPHLHGVYASAGWVSGRGAAERCSSFGAPPLVAGSYGSLALWEGTEYWHGSFVYIPGKGDQELLKRSPQNMLVPAGASVTNFSIVTKDNWQIRCLPSMHPLNGAAGQAFVAVSPEGTQYQFDWMVSRALPLLTKSSLAPEAAAGTASLDAEANPSGLSGGDVTPAAYNGNALVRREFWILPTKITDRFGNTVTYTYDTTNKWQLKTIVGSDASGSARTISITYSEPGGQSYLIRSISDGSRTWRYQYSGDAGSATLEAVVLPDGARWQLSGLDALLRDVMYLGDGNCDVPGIVNSSFPTGSMTHPSGAVGTFFLTPTRHGRVGVPKHCVTDLETQSETSHYPKAFDTYALTKKTISGPGLPAMEWVTSYSPAVSGWAPWDGQSGTKFVEVRDPEGNISRHTFGTVYMQNEGQLQLTEQFDQSHGLLRTTAVQYSEAISPRGYSEQRRGDGDMAARSFEVDRREIVQQGTSFIWEVHAFNDFAQPTRVTRSSSLGTRQELTTYSNNLAKWVLGQVETVTEESSGKQSVRNTFNPLTANLEEVRRFGLLEKSMSYHPDGTLASEKDGLNQETRYTNYRRGIPQNVMFANGTGASAVVNNLGGIVSFTDAAGATTSFTHDAMGRVASIVYPGGDPVAWSTTKMSFSQIWAPEYDLPAGHWRQTITTGTGVETHYFDAFWRPVYSERWDAAERAGTQRIVKRQYDADGRPTFESYPARTYAEAIHGIRHDYDALGRVASVVSDSERGPLRSESTYNASFFEKVQTDARGLPTTYRYQAFDQPAEDAITEIVAPEGVTVKISRDLFGKTLAVSRSGGGKSLTRSYIYDGFERLCKTIEPETGATIQTYDAANNVKWRATGLAMNAAICDSASVPVAKRTAFTYDKLNRLETTTYGDGSPSIGRTYTPTGLLKTISSNGAGWSYDYNKRGLNIGETLTYGGKSYAIGRSYDANGWVSQLRYPTDNLVINYAPNGLGETRKVGGYATDIRYHPNGAVAAFSYGNGIRRELKQNLRGLPEGSTDAGVLDETYVYDANANIEQIVDQLHGTASRTMGYDGLDRLRTVTAPKLWGTAAYTYDGLDNLVNSSISGGANARTLTHTVNAATNRLDSISGGPAGFNFSYGYDAQGNITRRGTQIFRFDQGNRMTSADGRATYVYDGLGRRVSTVGTDQVNTIQIYTQAGKLLYSGPAGGGGTKYIHLNNHVIAEVK